MAVIGSCSRLRNISLSLKLIFFLVAAVLLPSSTISGSSFSASPANNNNESCQIATLTDATASGSDPNFSAAAALDDNQQTLWSTYGKGSWITLDLGEVKHICSVDIRWYKGDQRWNNFIISTSNDGSSYHKVFDSKSSGHTLSFERYNLKDIASRYIRITVNGNTQNNYASIADITVSTKEPNNKSLNDITSVAALSEACVEAKISKVTASANHKNYVPANTVDKDDKTRWVNEKKNSWIKLDLGKTKTICNLDVQWFKGNARVYSFTVAVSKDNKKFTDIAKLKSSGKTNGIESYVLKDVDARYLRITVTANTENNFGSIVEIAIGTKNKSNPPPSTDKCDSNLPINSVTSSGNQPGNAPSGAIDNDLNTRWSNQGFGSWIKLDLGKINSLCSLKIAWYRGNERVNSFEISTSNDDITFNRIALLKSTGTTSALENIDISDTNARYVKITVTGNTQNDWISISEIDIIGKGIQQPPPPPPGDTSPPTLVSVTPLSGAKGVVITTLVTATFSEPLQASTVSSNTFSLQAGTASIAGVVKLSADGKTATFDPIANLSPSVSYTAVIRAGVKDVAGNAMTAPRQWSFTTAASPPPPPPPPPGPGSDGIKHIYSTALGGETWFFNPDNPDDGQFDPNGADISKNADGSWHLDPGTTRMLVFPKSAGLLSDSARGNLPTYDYSELAQIGHWYKPTDWKNTEMTGYFRVTSTQGGDGISFVTRSVRHNEAVADGCGGSSYHNNIRFEGTFQYKKEQWHVNYDILSPTKSGIGSVMDKWVGFKGIVYNLPNGNVKLESYVDKNNNNQWEKVQELTDSGNWGDDMTHCNASKDGAQITWGSPMAIFKSTGVTYDFKKLSLREIAPPSQ
jgi:Bacterial Ig-like domain/F5/8 type C domain